MGSAVSTPAPSSTNNFPALTPPFAPPFLPASRTPTLGLDPLPLPPTQSLPSLSTGGILGGLAGLATLPPTTLPTPAPPLPRTPTLGLDPLPWPPTQSLPSLPTGGILGGLAGLETLPPGTTPTPAPPIPRTPTLGLDPLPLPPTQSLPNLPTGGILGGLAALGTPSPAPQTSSLAGESYSGSGGPTPPAMPDTLQAFWDGLRAGSRQVTQSVESFSGPPAVADERSPAAEPLGWSDLASPSGIAPKLAYQFAQSYPTAAGGVAGGIIGGRLGAFAGPEGAAAGALIGGGLGAAALSAAQTLGPVYAAELRKNPNDPEGAWNRAWRQAEISGVFSGAAWAVFPARFFQSPVKQLVFQMFGAQPALSVGHRVASNIVEGRPATEGLGEAYGQGVVGTAMPALGHTAVRPFLPKRAPTINDRRPAEPITPPYTDGSFSISDWSGYPDNVVPRPNGPFRLLHGKEYDTARKTANRVNQKTRDANPLAYVGKQIHEIHTVKFGGDPIDPKNKIVLSAEDHRRVSRWWERQKWNVRRGKRI
jgi:hypothetical protein